MQKFSRVLEERLVEYLGIEEISRDSRTAGLGETSNDGVHLGLDLVSLLHERDRLKLQIRRHHLLLLLLVFLLLLLLCSL